MIGTTYGFKDEIVEEGCTGQAAMTRISQENCSNIFGPMLQAKWPSGVFGSIFIEKQPSSGHDHYGARQYGKKFCCAQWCSDPEWWCSWDSCFASYRRKTCHCGNPSQRCQETKEIANLILEKLDLKISRLKIWCVPCLEDGSPKIWAQQNFPWNLCMCFCCSNITQKSLT